MLARIPSESGAQGQAFWPQPMGLWLQGRPHQPPWVLIPTVRAWQHPDGSTSAASRLAPSLRTFMLKCGTGFHEHYSLPNSARGASLSGRGPAGACPPACQGAGRHADRDEHSSLAEFVEQARGDDVEFVVEIPFPGREQDLEAAFHRQTRSDDKNVLGKPGVLRIGDFVDDLPGDQHRHDDGFSRTRGHLGAQPAERSSIGGNVDADLLRSRGFREPD